MLAQYAPPDELLAAPADDFVARFVGRRPRRSSAWRSAGSATLELLPATATAPRPTVAPDTSLRDALSLMLADGGRPLVGRRRGRRGVGWSRSS